MYFGKNGIILFFSFSAYNTIIKKRMFTKHCLISLGLKIKKITFFHVFSWKSWKKKWISAEINVQKRVFYQLFFSE